jgi:hypothetical protein
VNRRILSSLLVAASLALVAAPAAAQAPAPGPDVRALLDEAARAAQAGDHATALDRFRAAYARYKSPAILLNIGTALHRLGRYPEAAVAYEQYLRDPGANPDRIAEVRRALADVEGRVARVTVGASDAQARVWVDGAELPGFAPGASVRLTPGEHVIAAGREGPIAQETVRVAAGEARSVFLKLPAVAAPPPPPAPIPVVVIPAAPAPELPPVIVEQSNGGQVASGVLVGVGGMAFAGGLIAGLYALVRNHDASQHCLDGGAACDAEGVRIDRQVRAAANASSVLLGAGTAMMLTGAIVGAATRTRGPRGGSTGPRVAVTPIPGGAFAGLEVAW